MSQDDLIHRTADSLHLSVISTKSIAILPFVNRSSDPENEYFSDGITEDIINALASVKGLKVTARTSAFAFKGKNLDVRAIAQTLHVATILEGSVRKVQQRVRITAQLVDAQTGTQIWSKNFDRELADIFAVQDEVSLLIADQIRENFGHFDLQDHLIESPTQNLEAYNLYLKGRHHQLQWNAEGLLAAVAYYQASIELDPQFSLPYFGAGLCCGINASWGFVSYEEGIQKAEAFLSVGLALEQESYLSSFAQATISFWGRWDFKAGYDQLLRAIELNPSFTDAEEGLAELLTAIGDFDQALEHTRQILSLNPLSPNHYYTQANIYYLSGSYEAAITCAEQGLKVDPQFALLIELIALCLIQLKAGARLDEFLFRYPQLDKDGYCRNLYYLMYSDEPQKTKQEKFSSQVRVDTTVGLVPWRLYVHVYLGNIELALDMLEVAVAKRTGQLINFRHDPFLQKLNKESRWKKIVNEVFSFEKLPEKTALGADVVEIKKMVLAQQEVEHYLSRVEDLMEQKQVFLDQELSLKSLAELLNLHPNKLSWLINECIGCNFNEYINGFRLMAFKKKALDPANSHLTLLGLAYESGFNSKTVFNATFKKMEGTTPRRWLKQQQAL